MQKTALERILDALRRNIDLNQIVSIEQIGEITYQVNLVTGAVILAFDNDSKVRLHLFEEAGT